MLCRKVKTILVIMGICCFPMISWAQVFLSGRIVDKKTNEPVVGASVYTLIPQHYYKYNFLST